MAPLPLTDIAVPDTYSAPVPTSKASSKASPRQVVKTKVPRAKRAAALKKAASRVTSKQRLYPS